MRDACKTLATEEHQQFPDTGAGDRFARETLDREIGGSAALLWLKEDGAWVNSTAMRSPRVDSDSALGGGGHCGRAGGRFNFCRAIHSSRR